MEKNVYDLIIIGSGPAGLTASIYASRYKLKNVVFGPEIGGTISKAHKVENYPGYTSISGLDLATKIGEQVKNLGAEIKPELIAKITKKDYFEVETIIGDIFYSKTILLASGTERRKLNVPGEREYLGRGVSYCTNCDAPFFRNKTVAVIGGGDAAVTGALHLEAIATKTYLIYRKEKSEMRAEPTWIEQLEKSEVVSCVFKTNPIEIIGDGQKVTGIKLDVSYNDQEILSVDGVFIEIGAIPVSNLAFHIGVEVDDGNFIKVNERMKTNIEGVYAAGDITEKSRVLQQIITAQAQGAIAASSIFKELRSQMK